MNEQKTLVDALRAVRMQYNEIKAYEARIARLNATAERTTSAARDGCRGTREMDARMSAKAAALDLEAELNALRSSRAAEVDELRPMIAHLPLYFREVIRLRDFDGMSWPEVASDMGFTDRWCQTLQQRAYQRLEGRLRHPKDVASSV
jgi:DNA-directed RNA polymerase specialized sigma24 family protein